MYLNIFQLLDLNFSYKILIILSMYLLSIKTDVFSINLSHVHTKKTLSVTNFHFSSAHDVGKIWTMYTDISRPSKFVKKHLKNSSYLSIHYYAFSLI